jgi:hypothetical protein
MGKGGKSSKFCKETKQLMSNSHKGKKHLEETKLSISKSLSGRKNKISNTKKNSELSEESKNRMSRLGMKHKEETKLKLSNYNFGKIVSYDTREKKSQSLRKSGKELPMYVHKKEEKPNSYHGSGYIVRVSYLKK